LTHRRGIHVDIHNRILIQVQGVRFPRRARYGAPVTEMILPARGTRCVDGRANRTCSEALWEYDPCGGSISTVVPVSRVIRPVAAFPLRAGEGRQEDR